MSKHIALPIEGHLGQVLHIMGYLNKDKKMRLILDSSKQNVKVPRLKEYDLIQLILV